MAGDPAVRLSLSCLHRILSGPGGGGRRRLFGRTCTAPTFPGATVSPHWQTLEARSASSQASKNSKLKPTILPSALLFFFPCFWGGWRESADQLSCRYEGGRGAALVRFAFFFKRKALQKSSAGMLGNIPSLPSSWEKRN